MDNGAIEPRLDIISDAICPWCYIGKRQVERALPLLADQGLNFSVHWHPFQLNPDMPEAGVGAVPADAMAEAFAKAWPILAARAA